MEAVIVGLIAAYASGVQFIIKIGLAVDKGAQFPCSATCGSVITIYFGIVKMTV